MNLPRTLVVLLAIGIVGSMLRAGTVDITDGVDPLNPTGIEVITPILEPLLVLVGLIRDRAERARGRLLRAPVPRGTR